MSVAWPFSISGGALANHLWQSTFFALAVWLLTVLLRRNPARIRYGLWLAASLKFLVPFALLIALGSLLPQRGPAVSAAPEAIYSAVDVATQPFPAWEPAPVAHASPTFAQRVAGDLPGILLALWSAGTLAVLLAWFLRWRRLHATLRNAVPAQSGRELDLLRRVETTLGAREPLPLRLSGELIEPGIFGIMRPVLVWPALLTEHLEDEHIQAILTHELVHARRRDNLTAALHMLVEAVLWFDPLVWWIGRRLLVERERACDEAVVLLGGHPERYAESLLKACRFCIESPLPCVSGITGADLKQRIVGIVNSRGLLQVTWPKRMLLITAAVCVIAAPLVLGQVRSPQWPMRAGERVPFSGGSTALDAGRATAADDSEGPEFEVATIRPSDPNARFSNLNLGTDDIRSNNLPVLPLLQFAYQLNNGSKDQLLGAPAWISTVRFNIDAKMDEGTAAAIAKMSAEERIAVLRKMVRRLLVSRFHLVVHPEARTLPVLALRTTTRGAKLVSSQVVSTPKGQWTGLHNPGAGEMEGRDVTMQDLVNALSAKPEIGGRLVVDETGLSGRYNFTLVWAPENTNALQASAAGPSLFTALTEQLGLQLYAKKARINCIVVDHIEQPTVDGAEVARAQPPATTQLESGARPIAFEVVSIRENKSGSHEGKMDATGDGWRMVNMPFEGLLQVAFVPQPGGPAFFPNGAIQGMPAWGRDRYDVVAKVPQSALADWKNSAEQPGMLHAMLQTALAERCGLKVHRERKTIDILALVVAKGGPKLKPADPNAPPHPEASKIPGLGFAVPEDGGNTIRFYGANLALFTNVLDKGGALNVQDRTGLTGKYDFVIHMPDPPAPAPGESAAADDPRYFADAVAEQLGLKLVPAKGQVETLVIDHLERPTEN